MALPEAESRGKRDFAGKNYICVQPGCRAKFPTSSQLKKHSVFHLNERPYLCTYENCAKSFFTIAHLQRHTKSHEKPPKLPKVFNCTYCKGSFKNKFSLRLHEAVHTGNKPLKCDKCDASFVVQSRLKRHMKSHLGYQCTKCSFKADHWSILRKHKTQHRQKCPKCAKKFASSIKLEAHLKKHDEVFTCSYCPRKYNKNYNLMAHMRAAHEGIRHPCPECGKEFPYKQSLLYHQESLHSGKVKPIVSKKRILTAVLLTGYDDISLEEKDQLLQQDKQFRLENPKYR